MTAEEALRLYVVVWPTILVGLALFLWGLWRETRR